MNNDRNWDILFIGGASGTGKSSLAYEIAKYYGINALEVDDIHIAIKNLTTKESHPAIHNDTDWIAAGVEFNVNWLIDVSREIEPILKEIINRHIEEKLPIVIEGDFIQPEFTKSFNNPCVKSIFVIEKDKTQIVENYLTREGGEIQSYRAEISIAYGEYLKDICIQNDIKTIEPKPWDTSVARALELLK